LWSAYFGEKHLFHNVIFPLTFNSFTSIIIIIIIIIIIALMFLMKYQKDKQCRFIFYCHFWSYFPGVPLILIKTVEFWS